MLYSQLLIQQELMRRQKSKLQLVSPTRQDWKSAVIHSLFAQQKAFVLSPSKAKIAQCTRRAGKTEAACVCLLLAAALNPNSTALYLALTRKSAKNLLWPKLKKLKAQYNIPLEFNESDLTAMLPNGAKIMLYGADQENVVERLRGDAYCICVVDEAASFGEHLDYVIEDVIEPALLDYNGALIMVGSPGPTLTGPFYRACIDPGEHWELHKWSVLDNTYLPHAREWIIELKNRRRWTDDNPTYLREYCNVWTEDPDALIYKFVPGRDYTDELPGACEWHHVLGVDLGYSDSAAWTVVAWSEDCPSGYAVHTEKHAGWIPSQWAGLTLALQSRWKTDDTVIDCGGLGKAIVEEFRQRWGIPCEAAEKSEKMAFIELVNGDFREERFKLLRQCEPLGAQYRALCKDKSGNKEHPDMPNDLCDSALYAYRKARHYFYREKDIEPMYGSAEYWKKTEREMIEKIERSMRQDNSNWLERALA